VREASAAVSADQERDARVATSSAEEREGTEAVREVWNVSRVSAWARKSGGGTGAGAETGLGKAAVMVEEYCVGESVPERKDKSARVQWRVEWARERSCWVEGVVARLWALVKRVSHSRERCSSVKGCGGEGGKRGTMEDRVLRSATEVSSRVDGVIGSTMEAHCSSRGRR
jgi:hypothetical protein